MWYPEPAAGATPKWPWPAAGEILFQLLLIFIIGEL
jgi:hypothetical protein